MKMMIYWYILFPTNPIHEQKNCKFVKHQNDSLQQQQKKNSEIRLGGSGDSEQWYGGSQKFLDFMRF